MLTNLEYASPYWFFALLIIPGLIIWYIYGILEKRPHVKFSYGLALDKIGGGYKRGIIHLPFIIKMIALSLIIVSLTRPRHGVSEREIITEGIDIMAALDVSTSMLAEDFSPNRLGAAKIVARDFINGRKTDRIGLVVFAGEAFTQAPLTLDYNILTESLEFTQNADPEWDGTAIGMGLATSVNRLKESKTKNKVIILLTDGENNSGKIDPKTAANLAQEFGIKVYTIGVGSRGIAPIPMIDQRTGRRVMGRQQVSIDEGLLKEIASNTGGRYFRATNNNSLRSIFKEIDQLEKNRIEVLEFTNFTERFYWFLIPGFILMLLEMLLRRTWLRRIP